MLKVRLWDPQDAPEVSRLQTAFTTDVIYRVVDTGPCLRLDEVALDMPLIKSYPIPPPENPAGAFVAEADGRIVGYAELVFESWNRRASIRHLYVSDTQRGQGVGRALLVALDKAARGTDARCLWIETQNVNHPAVQFYQHAGFELSGFDRSFYDPASTPGEVALFFSRDL